ncbi:hypothetical protein [Paenibacillus montaniterrae]|uniref:hypothetical protein n=1 Tax=Paenibacillus montaniterrae TaxID=429341 RepID=UPI001BCC3770|nr:hypothetical protein [Paenibacillus montaniterrae]
MPETIAEKQGIIAFADCFVVLCDNIIMEFCLKVKDSQTFLFVTIVAALRKR